MKILTFGSKGLLLLALSTLFLLSSQSDGCKSKEGTWEKIGTREVNYDLDKDEIIATRLEGIFQAIQV
ncbi:MAG: hypothetical protein ABIQ93_09945, partial [Saprospiraceae bacterium]